MFLRTFLYMLLVMLFAQVFGVMVSHGAWAEEESLAWWQKLAVNAVSADVAKNNAEIDRYQQELAAREDDRCAVGNQVLAGKINLIEAAIRFKYVNNLLSVPLQNALATLPGANDDEKVCRQVIRWVDCNTYQWPANERSAILERLEAELRDQRDFCGKVALPQNVASRSQE